MSAAAKSRVTNDNKEPVQEPKVVTDLQIPGRDPNQVRRFLDGEIEDRGEALGIIDDIETLAATHDPAVAIQAVLGMPAEKAIYQFTMGGKPVSGISTKGAQALMGWRGEFEEHVPIIEETSKKVQIRNEDGQYEIHDVDAYRAIVRLTDTAKRTTFVGVCTQAAVIPLRDGGFRLDEHAEQVAVSKALRNAVLLHFAGVAATVQKFVEEAKARGDVLILGQVSADVDAASEARDAAQKHFRLRRSEPLGKSEAAVFRAECDRFVAEAKAAGKPTDKLNEDLLAFMARQWGDGVKTADIPATDRGVLYGWLNDKRVALGLAPLAGWGVAPSPEAARAVQEPQAQAAEEPPVREPGQDDLPEDQPAPTNGDLFGDDDKRVGKKK